MKRLTEDELKQIEQAILVMVRVGNELNWNGPVIDEFYVHSINALRAIRDCRRTKRTPDFGKVRRFEEDTPGQFDPAQEDIFKPAQSG